MANDGNSFKTRVIGGWEVTNRLGRGGNGEVFRAEKDGCVGAIKLLTNGTPKRVSRFRDEVAALRQCSDIAGVLPVFDAHLDPQDGRSAWFVMGMATTIAKALGTRPTLRRVVEACAQIATTLSAMHARGVSHRDIKPDNLFFFNEEWAVGDFGLVSFEGKHSKTAQGERIGPMFFIAPEMLNEAVTADGRCADTYSLAKTLWVLATGQRFPLPGPYDISQDAFRVGTYLAEEGTGPLDKLIASSTVFSPEARPTMAAFAEELNTWLRPKAGPTGEPQLDTRMFAAELDRRRLAVEAAQAREKIATSASEAVYRRFREALRPLANEIADSLERANFEPVRRIIDNYTWGFEIGAGIPAEGGPGGMLRLIVNVSLIATSTVQLTCQIVLDRSAPTTFGGLLWESNSSFLEGGSQENLHLQHLREDIFRELPTAVSLGLSMVLGGVGVVRQNASYSIGVQSCEVMSRRVV